MNFPKLQQLLEARKPEVTGGDYVLAEALAEVAMSKKEVLAALKGMSAKDRKAICDKLRKMVEADEAAAK